MTNEERFRDMREAWNAHRLADAEAYIDPHIVWDTRGLGVLGTEGVYYGLEEFRRYWAEWLPLWSEIQSEVVWIHSNGDRLVAWLSQTNVGRQSGIELTGEYAWDMMWRDGKLIRVEFASDEDDARRRAGIA